MMDILFWSGGKDAFLALQFYRRQYPDTRLQLLTTFEEATDTVPHQTIAMSHIRGQARTLDLPLIAVPLPPSCPNAIYKERVKKAIAGQDATVRHLVFGDWHLEDIRHWREDTAADWGYSPLFPIWKKPLHTLLPELLLLPVSVTISAVMESYKKYIAVGETYDQHFVRQLPKTIDPMGENGEFHTVVHFQDPGDE